MAEVIKRHLRYVHRKVLVLIAEGQSLTAFETKKVATGNTIKHMIDNKMIHRDAGSITITDHGKEALKTGFYELQPHTIKGTVASVTTHFLEQAVGGKSA